MELKGLLTRSKEPAARSFPNTTESSPHSIYVKSILTLTYRACSDLGFPNTIL
jgi:hypothetical protein